jgi:hypothetical protein
METKELSFRPYDPEGKEPYIFASYAHEDLDAVADIEKLNEIGYRIWYDEKIEDADIWELKIAQAIRGCTLFLIFASKHSANSRWVRLEIRRAIKEKRDITPIFFEAGQINTDFMVIDELLDRQGIERFRFVKDNNLEGYYIELTTKLPKETRKCDEARECEILGMCAIRSIEDIVHGREFDPEYDRQVLVQKLRETVRQTGRAVYSIETLFQLTSEETGAVENLGKIYLSETSEKKPTHLLTHPLNIGTAYIAPLRLVTGLITRLDENWPPLVASYRNLVSSETRNRLEDLQYFIEFCWLAWGPSVLTTSLLEDNSAHFMVVQAAFGDEANSLPLIMKKEKWREIVSEFQKLHDEQILKERFEYRKERGWPVRLENVLIVKPQKDQFFKGISDHQLFSNMFTKKKGGDPDKVALYLPSGDEGWDPGSAVPSIDKQEAFYSTAYVWLMIEPEDDSTAKLTPGHVIPFFEHANLATSKCLQFLQHCLARKAIYHILECEEDPEYREKGVYRFATALFSEQMIDILEIEKKRLRQKDQETVERRLNISHDPKTWRSPAEVVRFADALSDKITDVLTMHQAT